MPEDISPEKALANMTLGTPPSGAQEPLPTTFESPYSRISSYFGRVNYDFNRKFLASFTARPKLYALKSLYSEVVIR